MDDLPEIDLDELRRQHERDFEAKLAYLAAAARRFRKNIRFDRSTPRREPGFDELPEIDLAALERQRARNFEARLAYVVQHARWVRSVPNAVWSREQKRLIDRRGKP